MAGEGENPPLPQRAMAGKGKTRLRPEGLWRVKKSRTSFGTARKTTNYNPMNISSGRVLPGCGLYKTVCDLETLINGFCCAVGRIETWGGNQV